MNTRTIDLKSGAVRRFVMFFCMTLLVLAIPATAMAAPVRLFIDPGHGGKDPGAVSGGLMEKDSNLKISKYVAESAKRQGWAVKMSRTTDKFIPLPVRPKMANQWKATNFISIHSNSTGSKMLGNSTIWRTRPGGRMGHEISREMNKLTPYKDTGNYQDRRGLAVLRGAKMDATLVEVLSVSPAKERAVLKTPSKQRAYAEAIVRGIAKHEGVKYVPPAKPKAEKKTSASPLPTQPAKATEPTAEANAAAAETKAAAKTAEPATTPATSDVAKAKKNDVIDAGRPNESGDKAEADKQVAASEAADKAADTSAERADAAKSEGLIGMLMAILSL